MQIKAFLKKNDLISTEIISEKPWHKVAKWQFGLKSMDSDSAESLLDSVEYRIPPKAESES